ncbi:UbiD family decarboxylase [Candidatus Aerophobetes bacterium]|nr:UbiD family decarboxylase [Candidatus Aerophobetes bacterium]
MAYKDLREYLQALTSKGLMKWVEKEVDKDWEITCIARKVFQREPDKRFALGFKKIKGHSGSVVVGTVAASRGVYATSLQISPEVEEVIARWDKALTYPQEPKISNHGVCQEVVREGKDVNLNWFPIPTWTPDKDPGPYITAPCMITRDLKSGIRNVGIYRMQVKGANRTGVLWDLPSQHAAIHFAKYEAEKIPMPVAVAIGVDPCILMAAAAKVPLGVDELAVAGGLRGEPVSLVKCKSIDLEVPATAEIILEGEILPGEKGIEGPFGEYTGYMGGPYELPLFHIKCITHRKDPIYQALHSQMPPSESSLLRQIAEEANVYKHLVHQLKIPGVIDVHLPEAGGSYAILWIRMKTAYPGHAQQVLCAAWTHHPTLAKWIVVTDEDIDIRDAFIREWVLSWRVEPSKDIHIFPGTSSLLLDPSVAPPDVPLWERPLSSKVLINATRKWKYPEIALPPSKYLHKVEKQWEEYGL